MTLAIYNITLITYNFTYPAIWEAPKNMMVFCCAAHPYDNPIELDCLQVNFEVPKSLGATQHSYPSTHVGPLLGKQSLQAEIFGAGGGDPAWLVPG